MAIRALFNQEYQKIQDAKPKDKGILGDLGDNPLFKALVSAGLGYLTGGLGTMIPGVIGGAGATAATAFAPSAATVLPALGAGVQQLEKPESDPLNTGVQKGLELPLAGMKSQAEKGLGKALGYDRFSTKIGGTTASLFTPEKPGKGAAGKTPTQRINAYYQNAPVDMQRKIDRARSSGHSDASIAKMLKI